MNTFWGIPYFVWLAVCIFIAIAYFIFLPKEVRSVNLSAKNRFIISYAHSMVWLLFALACFMANYQNFARAQFTALIALFTYLLFIVTFIKLKIKEKNEKPGLHQK